MSAGKEVAIEVSVPALGMGTGAELELRGEGGEIGLESMVGRVEIGELGDEERKGKRGKEVEKLGEKDGGGEKRASGEQRRK